jgi:hypothetical protein
LASQPVIIDTFPIEASKPVGPLPFFSHCSHNHLVNEVLYGGLETIDIITDFLIAHKIFTLQCKMDFGMHTSVGYSTMMHTKSITMSPILNDAGNSDFWTDTPCCLPSSLDFCAGSLWDGLDFLLASS